MHIGGSIFGICTAYKYQKAVWCHSGVYGKEYLQAYTKSKTVMPIPVIPNRGHNMKLIDNA